MQVKKYRDKKITEVIEWDGTLESYHFICEKFNIRDTIVNYRDMKIYSWEFKSTSPGHGIVEVLKGSVLCKEGNSFYTAMLVYLETWMEEII